MIWVYRVNRDEPSGSSAKYTVGYYGPDGRFEPESDHATSEAAAQRAGRLNGGGSESTPEPEPLKLAKVISVEVRGSVHHTYQNVRYEVGDRFLIVHLGKDINGCEVKVTFPMSSVLSWSTNEEPR